MRVNMRKVPRFKKSQSNDINKEAEKMHISIVQGAGRSVKRRAGTYKNMACLGLYGKCDMMYNDKRESERGKQATLHK